jgi:hypothetical protein
MAVAVHAGVPASCCAFNNPARRAFQPPIAQGLWRSFEKLSFWHGGCNAGDPRNSNQPRIASG